jgi:type I restriction enzyme S subunit
VRSRFLSLWVNSDLGKRQVLEGQGGLAQQHFNIREMRRLLVKMPKRSEQERIEKTLIGQACYLDEALLQISKLRRLKVGLMQDLLTGNRRVIALLDKGDAVTG